MALTIHIDVKHNAEKIKKYVNQCRCNCKNLDLPNYLQQIIFFKSSKFMQNHCYRRNHCYENATFQRLKSIKKFMT